MAYVRSKMINGYGPYYYKVESVREGDKVEQRYIAYLGKTPPAGENGPAASPSGDVVPNNETKIEKNDEHKEQEREVKLTPAEQRKRENDEKYLDRSSQDYKAGYEHGIGMHYYNQGEKEKNRTHMTDDQESSEANRQLYDSSRTGNESWRKRDWNEKRGYLDGVEAAQSGKVHPEYGRIKFNGTEHAIDSHGNSYKVYRYGDGTYIFKDDKKTRIPD